MSVMHVPVAVTTFLTAPEIVDARIAACSNGIMQVASLLRKIARQSKKSARFYWDMILNRNMLSMASKVQRFRDAKPPVLPEGLELWFISIT